jgi:Glycosyl transferase family 90
MYLSYRLAKSVSKGVHVDQWLIGKDDASPVVPSDQPLGHIPTYSTESIAKAVNTLVDAPGRLLIYNPSNDTILMYSISNSRMSPPPNFCSVCHIIAPMLARLLWKTERLAPHLALLQIFFSDADFPYVEMQSLGNTHINGTRLGEAKGFCPWVQFGSVFRDSTILPTVHAFPFPKYLDCLEEMLSRQHRQAVDTSSPDQICQRWSVPFRNDLSWDELIPQIIWRGRNYNFLHTFRHEDFQSPYSVSKFPFYPRLHVVNMTNNGEPWINGSIPTKRLRTTMSGEQLSRYKYHIDLGGAGGTTWTGTLEKLAMPGLLFHHETPAKDFYYDSLIAWHHYVPVRTDLSDLHERYRWAEENQEEARAIAERGTAFAKFFFSYSNLQKVHERYFGESGVLSNIVDAYENPSNATTLESILREYQEKWNISLALVYMCTRQHCDVRKNPLMRSRTSIEPDICRRPSHDLESFGLQMERCL